MSSCFNRRVAIWACNQFVREKLSLYLPIEAWLIMSLVMHAQRELERPKNFSHTLFFE